VHCHGAASRCCLSLPQASSFALLPSNASEHLGRTLYWLSHYVERTHNERYPSNKKNYQHHLHILATLTCFFLVIATNFPSTDCTFVSTLQPYTQVPSPIMTFFIRFSSVFKWSNSSWLTVTCSFLYICQQMWQHDASSVCRSKSGGTNFYRFLLLWQLHGQLGNDFDESRQALSQCDRCPLKWKAILIWGHLRWTFCPIWNAGTIHDIAYSSNNPLHKPVATSEKSL